MIKVIRQKLKPYNKHWKITGLPTATFLNLNPYAQCKLG